MIGKINLTELDIRRIIANANTSTNTSHLVLLGTGDAANRFFNFSDNSIHCIAVFVDGILQSNSSWTVSTGTGPGGVDRLVFGSGNVPGINAVIEALIL